MAESTFIWQKESKKEKQTKWVLFFICPLLSFLYSLFSLKTKTSYIIIFCFFVIYGLCFTVGIDRDIYKIDASSVRNGFEEMVKTKPSEFAENIKGYFTLDITSYKDIFTPALMFVLSRFTSDYHFLFMIYATLFGLFTLKCLRYLTLDSSYKSSIPCFLLFLFFTINQIFNINGFRFYFAVWLAVLCCFKIIKDGDKRYWLLLLATPFFHISFFFFVPAFIVACTTNRLRKIWFVIFLLSGLISPILQNILNSNLNLPPMFSLMLDSYLSENAVSEYQSTLGSASVYAQIFRFLGSLYHSIMIFVLFVHKKNLTDEFDKRFLDFCVPIVAIMNIVMPFSSMGRFVILSYSLIAYLWLKCFRVKKFNLVIYMMPVFMFMTFYKYLLYYITYGPIGALFTPPLLSIIKMIA